MNPLVEVEPTGNGARDTEEVAWCGGLCGEIGQACRPPVYSCVEPGHVASVGQGETGETQLAGWQTTDHYWPLVSFLARQPARI